MTEIYSGPSGSRTTSQTWDAFDRLRTKTDPEGELLTYGYDAAGNRNRLTDPDGRTTLYQHDALNRLQSVLPPGTGATLYEYFGNSLLKKITYPNGATAAYGYDRANRVTSIENRQHTALVSSYVYAYDRNGNRTSQEETNGGAAETTTYVYDGADRLTEVHYPDQTVVYTLDGVGNRRTEETTEVPSGTITSNKTYGYNERDFLLTVTDSVEPANSATYDYDANGNQIEKTAVQSGVISSFIYDVRDQLVEVSTSEGLLETYGYSYDGLRTRKSGPGGLFRFVYDERSLLLQTDLAGLTIAKYEWGPDRLLSLDHAVEGRQFYLFDGLGSVASLSKPDGTLQARFRWDAWGNLRSQAGDSFNLFGFTGHQRDEETGLYYAQARFYDPEIGRFLSEDPFLGLTDTPPSLHRFLYAHSNPVFFTDPTGTCALGWDCFRENLGIGLDTAKGVAEDLAETAATSLDVMSGGLVTRTRTFVESEGALEERARASNEAAARATLSALTLGFSEAEDNGEHLKELVGVNPLGRSGTLLGEAIAEGDLEKALEATGEFLTGAGRLSGTALIVAAPAAEAGLIPKPGPTVSVPSMRSRSVRVESATIGESATAGGPQLAEVSVTRSAPATPSATQRPASSWNSREFVQEVAFRAEQKVRGTGAVAGTGKHAYAAALIDRYQRIFGKVGGGLSTEQSYLAGQHLGRSVNLPGSVRLDIVEGPLTNPTQVFDFKFTVNPNPTMPAIRVARIRANAGLNQSVPVTVVHP